MLFRRDRTDRAFRRFLDSGDPAALGEVFDATAAELLRVAHWLSGNRADAEDLLQRTFLTAIEARGRFDRDRRVMAWLCGILANHARDLRRLNRRHSEATTELRAADPRELAADREIAARIETLRGDLGAPYREVLDLHLGEGLGPKDIATRLQRKEGTVRTQLMRGLELLRRALPQRTVLAGIPLLITPRELAPLRARLLARLPAPALGTAAATSAILLMSKKLLLWIPVLLFGAGIAVYATSAPTPPPAPTPSVEPAADARSAQPAPRAAVDPDPARSAVATSAAPQHVSELAALHVTLRWSDDSSPASGVAVFVESAAMASAATSRHAVGDRRGEARLDGLLPGDWLVRTSHGGGVQRVSLSAGVVRGLTLAPIRTATLDGVVVDDAGQPVADATILLSPPTRGPKTACATSDGEGRFRLPLFGEQMVSARKTGFCASFETPVSDEARTSLHLVLRPLGGRVQGSVRDERGAPVPYAQVLVGPEFSMYLARTADQSPQCKPRGEQVVTDAEGRFDVDGVEPGPCDVRAWSAGNAPFAGGVMVNVGATSTLEIVLRPGALLAGTVTDADGSPVARATVSFGTAGTFAHGSTLSAEDGSYALDSLPIGQVDVLARKERMEAAANPTLTSGVVTTWDPKLAARHCIEGSVLRPEGVPFADLDVGCFQEGQIGPAVVARTDQQGHFLLDDVGDVPVTVQVTLRGHDAWQLQKDVMPGTRDLVIRIDARTMPSAWLVGRVVDTSRHAVRGHLRAMRKGADHCSLVPFDEHNGSFRVGPMPAGTYEVGVTTADFGDRTLGSIELDVEQTRDLGDIVMDPPGRATFTISADAPGPVARGSVILYTPEGEWIARADIERGNAVFEHLAPGRYLVLGDSQGAEAGADLVVQPAGNAHVDLHLVRSVRTTLAFDDPRPAEEGRSISIFAHRPDGSFAGLFGTWRRAGPLEAPISLPAGHYHLRCVVSDGRKVEVDVETGTERRTLKVALPD